MKIFEGQTSFHTRTDTNKPTCRKPASSKLAHSHKHKPFRTAPQTTRADFLRSHALSELLHYTCMPMFATTMTCILKPTLFSTQTPRCRCIAQCIAALRQHTFFSHALLDPTHTPAHGGHLYASCSFTQTHAHTRARSHTDTHPSRHVHHCSRLVYSATIQLLCCAHA